MLHGIDRANARFAGIEAGGETRATLAEEVPALIEAELDRAKSLALLIGYLSAALALAQLMLFMSESLDVGHHFVLGHLSSSASLADPSDELSPALY